MITFCNYHRHSMYTNVRISDSAVTNRDYAIRAKELGHKILSSVEHGWQGNYFDVIKLAKEYDLKPVIGAEVYWVKDRAEKDRNNCHMCIIAKNENGRQALNDILSEANITGFYGQPRVDIPLILSLPKDDVIVTTACLAYWKYTDIIDITKQFAEHFGGNFFLEVQYHNTDSQRKINKLILKLKNELNIPIIMGCDSHYIKPEDAQTRVDFLYSKGLEYPDEEGWYLDYPDGDTAYQRFATQCVLSHSEILEAINNTNVMLTVEEYNSPVFNDEIKLPSLHPDWTQEERDEEYKRLVWNGWDEYKKDIPESEWGKYIEEIKKEIQTVVDTHMSDYFICDYYIMKKGKENGGKLTKSGRGCFTKEAIIPTTTGFKHLNEVNIGDKVFDKDGKIQTVTNTMKYHINEPLVKINYAYMSDDFSSMICTGDHKILVKTATGDVMWKQANALKEGDFVCCPRLSFPDTSEKYIDLNKYNVYGYDFDDKYIYEKNSFRNKHCKYSPSDVAKNIGCGNSVIENIANGKQIVNKKNKKIVDALLNYTGFNSIEEYASYIQDSRTTKIARFIPNDYFMNFWIGSMYGDGFASFSHSEIGLAINTETHKDKINKTVFKLIANRVGLSTSEHVSRDKKLCQVYMHSNVFRNYVHTNLFVSQKNVIKTFNPTLLMQPKENLLGLLRGLTMTDGSYSETTRISFDNTSPSLLWAYRMLVSATSNVPTTIAIRQSWTTNEGYKCKQSYKLRSYIQSNHAPKKKERTEENENYTFLPVWGVTEIPASETDVYDITVENSHSYVLNNIVVHNSGASFFTNTLLGFSDVDRISASVHMYPERFMSTTRILQSKGIPDIDMNEAPTEPFVRAQAEVLGQDHSYPMVAYGTMKNSAAWKLYAKSQGVPFEIANAVSGQIRKYENAVKHADEDEKDDIDVNDYIDTEYKDIYAKSKGYLGLITSWSIAPCSSLIYMGSIRKEIGLVKVKDNICCLLDGHIAEEGHFLKNDHLKVSVVDLIYKSYRAIGIDPPKVKDLLKMCPPEDSAWDIFEKGCTIGINQCEKDGTRARVMKYKPRNISELSAFVAAIRPSGASYYKKFESREPFSYGVKAFDDLIQTKEFPYSFLLYQEQIMRALNYAGIDMAECYTAIKNIAKKRAEKVLAYRDTFVKGFQAAIIRDEGKSPEYAATLAENLWKIIEDAAGYGFNASHSYCVALDALYGAWLKAHHPLAFYETYLTLMEEKGDKDKMNALKEEAESYFKIKFPPFRFGTDNRKIKADISNNAILNSISSIKGYSASVGTALYDCGKQEFDSFVDVLKWLDDRSIKRAKIQPLIVIDYFQKFGNINELLSIIDFWDFLKQGQAKSVKKDKITSPILKSLFDMNCSSTKKDGSDASSYKVEDAFSLLYSYEKYILSHHIEEPTMKERIAYDMDVLGYADVVTNKEEDRRRLLITDVVPLSSNDGTLWSYRIGTKSLGSGKTARLTVKKDVFEKNKIASGDIIYAAELFKNKSGYWYLLSYTKEE